MTKGTVPGVPRCGGGAISPGADFGLLGRLRENGLMRAYREILTLPGAWQFSAAGLLARSGGAMMGIGLVLMVSALVTRAMTYIGQSTLILLIFHGEIQHKTFDLMERLGLHAFVAACIGFVVGVGVPLLIGEVIKRVAVLRFFYFPFPVRKVAEARRSTNVN